MARESNKGSRRTREQLAKTSSDLGISYLERVTRIELALSAWEADVLPLNYTRVRPHRLTLPSAWAVSAQTSYRTR
jgi:hypothetical protein